MGFDFIVIRKGHRVWIVYQTQPDEELQPLTPELQSDEHNIP